MKCTVVYCGGTIPISSGVKDELSIITPTPTLAAFCIIIISVFQ